MPLDIAGRILSPDEYEAFARLPAAEQMEGLALLWTRKESYVKAIGKGLGHPLQSFSVLPMEIGTVRPVKDGGRLVEWFCKSYAFETGYRLSVCTQSRDFPEQVELWEVGRIKAALPAASGE